MCLNEILCALCATGQCLHATVENEDCATRAATTMLNGTLMCIPCCRGRIAIEQELAFRELHGIGSTGDTDNSDTSETRSPYEIRVLYGGNVSHGPGEDSLVQQVIDFVTERYGSEIVAGKRPVEPGVEPDGPAGS